MAKHGGFPMGGMGNMQQLMKQAQRMQENMQKKQAELNAQEFSASSGGGMVKVTVNGAREVLSVEIDPQCVDPDDVETLQDILTAAVNEAIKTVSDTNNEEIIERNYKDVVMKRGYIHSVKTTFDLMDIETSFTFEDWTEEDVPR